MIRLKDLEYKPVDGDKVLSGKIIRCRVGKQFHFGSLTLDLNIEADDYCYSFLGDRNLNGKYLGNVANLILELFGDYMNKWEYLSFDDIINRQCECVERDRQIIAIGRKDNWINIEELVEKISKLNDNQEV